MSEVGIIMIQKIVSQPLTRRMTVSEDDTAHDRVGIHGLGCAANHPLMSTTMSVSAWL